MYMAGLNKNIKNIKRMKDNTKMSKIKKTVFIFILIFSINFFSLCFLWLNAKFGSFDLKSLIYHLELIRVGNLLNPDHHLTESFVFYQFKINFILTFILTMMWTVFYQISYSSKEKKKSYFKFLCNISELFIKKKIIWVIILLFFLYGLISLIKNYNFENQIFQSNNYYKLNLNEIKNVKKQNLIIIYAESLDSSFENLNGVNYLKNLTDFKEKYLSLDKFIQLKGTGWTAAGIFSSQCGIPLLNGIKDLESDLTCLPDVLSSIGYKNYFLLGHDINFQSLHLYANNRYDHVIDYKEIDKNYNLDSSYKTGWALSYNDKALFHLSKKILNNTNSNFFLTILTSDTHGPLGTHQQDCYYKYKIRSLEETLECFDSRIVNFLDFIINKHGDDTLIVLMSDHLMMSGVRFYKDYFDKKNRTMTNIFISNQFNEKKLITRDLLNHYDIYPTILNFLDIYNKTRLRYGVSIFDKNFTNDDAYKNNNKLNKLDKQSNKKIVNVKNF